MNNPVFTRDNLIELLSHNVLTVRFIKVDGIFRDLRCTLIAEYLPSAVTSNGQVLLTETTEKKLSPNVLPVWDLEEKCWKSFRINSVTGVTIE